MFQEISGSYWLIYQKVILIKSSELGINTSRFHQLKDRKFKGFVIITTNSTMKFSTVLLSTSFALLATASPVAEALPWAKANPQAAAAAQAFADAHAEAIAIGHPDPTAYALAASADDCASVTCHMNCGLMIVAGEDCSENEDNSYAGPYTPGCLCNDAKDTTFQSYYDACMDCGWTLWKYYSGYLSSALDDCHSSYTTISTEPTGTSRCSTTLTDSYTVDTGINYSTYI